MSSSRESGDYPRPSQDVPQESKASVDPSSNIRGAYRTIFFRCPWCDYPKVFLKIDKCPSCGVKLNWN